MKVTMWAITMALFAVIWSLGCKDKDNASAKSIPLPTATASVTPTVPATVSRAWCEGPLRARVHARFLSDGASLYPDRDPDFRQRVVDESVTNLVAKCLKADGTATDPTWTCYWDAPLKTYRDCDNARKQTGGVAGTLGITGDAFKKKWNDSVKEHGDKAGFTLGEPKRSEGGVAVYAVASDVDVVLATSGADATLRSVSISSPTTSGEFYEDSSSTTLNARLLAWRRVLETLQPEISAKQRRELDEEVVGLGRGGPIKDKPASASVARLGFKLDRFEKDGRRVLRVSHPSDSE